MSAALCGAPIDMTVVSSVDALGWVPAQSWPSALNIEVRRVPLNPASRHASAEEDANEHVVRIRTLLKHLLKSADGTIEETKQRHTRTHNNQLEQFKNKSLLAAITAFWD